MSPTALGRPLAAGGGLLLRCLRRGDVLLAAGLVAAMTMLILPLPSALIDALIAVNLCGAVLLLMVAVYLDTPLSFAVLPSVLLLSTVFRLALTVATTRLILLQADAGAIVDTFGRWVVGGNLAVGLVVFLIITVVQFVVVSKGAERVAEVGARFSLDALPGKQMSVDGDLRAGVIDADEARRRRASLQQESQLYGAMDGAMKFVKGDAVAGLCVIAVNLFGGLACGMLQHGMDAAEALSVYALLTVGDGLIAQIPALLVAVSAGLVVTRVDAGAGAPAPLGVEILEQLRRRPQALLAAAVLSLGFALLPGFPPAVFAMLALALGVPGALLAYRALGVPATGEPATGEPATGVPATGVPATGVPATGVPATNDSADEEQVHGFAVPLRLVLPEQLRPALGAIRLHRELRLLRGRLIAELGVPLPALRLQFSAALAGDAYRLELREVPLRSGRLTRLPTPVGGRDDGLARWRALVPGAAAPASTADVAAALGELRATLYPELRRHAAEFVGIQETQLLLQRLQRRYPDLVAEATRVTPIARIAEVLRRLLAEQVSVRDLRGVLEALAEWGERESDAAVLTEYARCALRRQLSHRYCDADGRLPALLLDAAAEQRLRAAVRQTPSGTYLALEPELGAALLDRLRAVCTGRTPQPVLLAPMDLRRYLHKLVETELGGLSVLSYQELSESVTVVPLARVALDAGGRAP